MLNTLSKNVTIFKDCLFDFFFKHLLSHAYLYE